jgi:nucleotide-binding universal stress UspA family protein
MFRTVLLHVDHNESSEDRIAAAIGVARAFNATLIGLAAGMPIIPYAPYSAAVSGVYVDSGLTELDRQRLEADLKRSSAAFEIATRESGIETEWEEMLSPPSLALRSAATSADLVILGAGDARLFGNENRAASSDVLLHIGRPALLIPENCREVGTGPALVAWKDTGEAQRAIADALPFLKRASAVTVLVVQEEGDETDSPKRAAAFLTRHGIAAAVKFLPREGSVEDQITGYARENGTNLIVAGAYGHTRLREWVFGGVTRELLARTPVPCLLSH